MFHRPKTDCEIDAMSLAELQAELPHAQKAVNASRGETHAALRANRILKRIKQLELDAVADAKAEKAQSESDRKSALDTLTKDLLRSPNVSENEKYQLRSIRKMHGFTQQFPASAAAE